MAVVKAKGKGKGKKAATRKKKRKGPPPTKQRGATKKKARAATPKPRKGKTTRAARSTASRSTPNAKRPNRTRRAPAQDVRRRTSSPPRSFLPPPLPPPLSAASAAIKKGRCPCGGANESCVGCFGTGNIGASQFDLTGPTRPKPEPEPTGPGLFDEELRAAGITRAPSLTSRSARSGVRNMLRGEESEPLHLTDRYVDALADLCQHEARVRGLVIDCPICNVACSGSKYAAHARTRHNALVAPPAYGRFSPEAYESVFKEFVRYRDQSERHAKRRPSKLPCSRCYRSVNNAVMHMRISHQEDWSTGSSSVPLPPKRESSSAAAAPVRKTARASTQDRAPAKTIEGWPTLGDRLRASGVVK